MDYPTTRELRYGEREFPILMDDVLSTGCSARNEGSIIMQLIWQYGLQICWACRW